MLIYQASRFTAALFLQRDWLVVAKGFMWVAWRLPMGLVDEKALAKILQERECGSM
jgi:hypothetical protein